ncbi:alpha/beta fold hydrolase [Streptosporangium vulgare]|uniref:Alpha/beta fold hydrolase n=1 Tax=Streptosporangium vulgare TaxID=46190 RepID=A0ABV5T7H2_9ACTN
MANPPRSVEGDAAYLRDVIAGIGAPVVLVGHSCGGMVISQAAATQRPVTERPCLTASPSTRR